jgi:hypothetical protein
MEAKTRVRWQKLVDAFNLQSKAGFQPWDASVVDSHRGLSSGEQHTVSFLLTVWDPSNRDWRHPRFDAVEAVAAWDRAEIDAFISWVNDPFWP